MLPAAVIALGNKEYTDGAWQKAKGPSDKATKTGLGAELITLRTFYDGAKGTLNKLDAGIVSKPNEEAVKAAKLEAHNVLHGSVVTGLKTHLETAATKATTVSKMKILSSGATQTAAAMAKAFAAAKKALESESLADFDAKLQHIGALLAAQRKDFKPAAIKLQEAILKLEQNPVAATAQGTEFSGAYRGFQNKIGNLPEFKDIYDPKFDGLFVEHMHLNKMTPEEIKAEMLKIVADTRKYMSVCLKRAKEQGY